MSKLKKYYVEQYDEDFENLTPYQKLLLKQSFDFKKWCFFKRIKKYLGI